MLQQEESVCVCIVKVSIGSEAYAESGRNVTAPTQASAPCFRSLLRGREDKRLLPLFPPLVQGVNSVISTKKSDFDYIRAVLSLRVGLARKRLPDAIALLFDQAVPADHDGVFRSAQPRRGGAARTPLFI